MQRLVPGSAWGCCWFKFEFCGLGVFCWDTGGCEKLCWGCCWKLLLGLCTTFMGLWDSGCWLKFCGRPPWPNSKSYQFFFIQRPYTPKRALTKLGVSLRRPLRRRRRKRVRTHLPPLEGENTRILLMDRANTSIDNYLSEEFCVSCRTWRTLSCSRACNSWNCKASCCSRLSRSACMASNCSASGDPRTANWRCTWRFCNRKRVFAGELSVGGIMTGFLYDLLIFLALKMWNQLFCNHRRKKSTKSKSL